MKFSKVPLLLKLRLKGAQPPIWRDIAIPCKTTMADLHQYIQLAFGWDDEHLHNFTINRTIEFCSKEAIIDSPYDAYDEAKYSVYEVLCSAPKILYTYDFGDNWEVEITCKGEYLKEPVENYCQIVKSKGENPPEDCGGIYGFMELLYYRQHPEECDDEIKERLAWYYPDEYENQEEKDILINDDDILIPPKQKSKKTTKKKES